MKFKPATIRAAIKDSGAIMSTVAKNLGCDWRTANKLINDNPEYKALIDAEREATIDKAESIIIMALNETDIQTAKWYLQTIGKKRGYSEKFEITGADGGPLSIIISDQYMPKFKKAPEKKDD